jgi:hypothetical protein
MRSLRSVVGVLCLMVLSVSATVAQTVDDIIQKHISAMGGLDNLKKLNSVKMVCSANAQGMEIPITMTTLNKKGFKMEMSISGMNCYTIVTDKEGWSYMPIMGQTKAEVLPDEMLKQSQDQLDLAGPLVDYKAKGSKIAYLGKDDVEGTDCFKLKVTYATGKEETMFIDAANYYHIRSVSKITANGKEQEQTVNFGNFQKTQGVVFPMSIDQGMGNVAVKSIEVNQPIAEGFFKPNAADLK